MKIKIQVFFLSILSTVGLTAITQATHILDSSDTKYVKMPSPKKKLTGVPESRSWLLKSCVLPILVINDVPRKTQEISRAGTELMSIGSVIQVLRSQKDRNESVIISPRGLNRGNSQTEVTDTNIGNGVSYTGPLTVQERQVEHVLAAVDALPNQDISSIFNVLNRSSIDKHPVYGNLVLHHLYEVAMPELVRKMRTQDRPLHQRKSIPSRMRPDLGLKDSLSTSFVLPTLDASKAPNALKTSQVFSIKKSSKPEIHSLSEVEQEPGFFAKKKNWIFNKLKAIPGLIGLSS